MWRTPLSVAAMSQCGFAFGSVSGKVSPWRRKRAFIRVASRQRILAGEKKAALAREFGISRETLYSYARGR
jgi:hypothetical protein